MDRKVTGGHGKIANHPNGKGPNAKPLNRFINSTLADAASRFGAHKNTKFKTKNISKKITKSIEKQMASFLRTQALVATDSNNNEQKKNQKHSLDFNTRCRKH